MTPLLSLDLSPAALEVEAAAAFREALAHRGLTVKHLGTATSCAPGNGPDIVMSNRDVHIIVEVTKLRRVVQTNNEATPVAAHLDAAAEAHPEKITLALFVSPQTFGRTVTLFKRNNEAHRDRDDKRIAFMDFDSFNLFLEWLSTPRGRRLSIGGLCDLLKEISALSDDLSVLSYLNDQCLKASTIVAEVERLRRLKVEAKYVRLDAVFQKLHNDLRSVAGLNPPEAFHELSKLIFLKMYEEAETIKATARGGVPENRFSSAYIARERQRRRGKGRHPIIELFEEVEQEFRADGLFSPTESINIQPTRDDGSYIDAIVSAIEDYNFLDPDLPGHDVKGVIYEQFLGLSLKNTELGQFFTPAPVIEFFVAAADLRPTDVVLDPACGTARFLVNAMSVMLAQCRTQAQRDRVRKKNIHGFEKSPYVAKIAKMNMFVHGDGRTSIEERDSLFPRSEDERRFTKILTNPPLGDINFRSLVGAYADAPGWYEAFDIIERRASLNRAGSERLDVARKALKGGALFLNLCAGYLRPSGELYTVIDEGILNTDEYSSTRDFIRSKFFVRAVISLTEDAFKHGSQTATKTSLLILERKRRDEEPQSTPVFFAHASQVGVTPKGKPCANELDDPSLPTDILRGYREFRAAVERAVDGRGRFDSSAFAFRATKSVVDPRQGYLYFAVAAIAIQNRLEFKWYDPTYRRVASSWKPRSSVALGAITDRKATGYGLTATGLPDGDIAFINIENLRPDGSIDLRGVRSVSVGHPDLRENHYSREGDILISRARLPGIAAVARGTAADVVFGSYIIRFRLRVDAEYSPEYVAMAINAVVGQAQVYRLKSGSNGYNINIGQLEAIRLPVLPVEEQRQLVAQLEAHRAIAARLARVIQVGRDAAEAALLESTLGTGTSRAPIRRGRSVDTLVAQLESALTAEALSPEVAKLAAARDRFSLRPSFSARFAADVVD